MAITATSLLQSKKLSIIKITPKFFNQVGSIKTTVISIKNIIVDKKLLIQPRPKKDLQLSSSKFFGLRRTSPIRLPSIIPNLGIEETLKRFILFTFFGNVFPKMIQFLPKLKGVVDGISGATKFVYEFTGNFFKGVVDAIDIGYKAATETKKFLNKITGSKYKENFDKFEDGLKIFINGAIIAGGLIGASGLTMPKLFKPKFNMGTSIKRAYGKSAFNDYKDLMKSGKTQSESLKEIQKNYTKRVGFAAPISKIFKKSPIGRATRFAKRVPIIGRVFSRVPIIGALIDFVISIMSGESVSRAAARAVGASVGAALGTLIPIPIAGTILGGVLGDVVGGALYDTLSSNFNKPKKYKSGGLIKRNGKIINAPIRRSKPKASAQKLQTRRYNPPKTYAGKDIGGEKKLSELFNDQKDPTVKSPLRSLKTTSQLLKTIPLFGGLMGASVDIAMGQKPDPNIYINFINNFNALIQNNSNEEVNSSLSEVNSSIMRMASGGVIPRTMAVTPRVDSERLGQIISTTFATMLNQRTNQIFQQIIKEISLKSPLMNPSGDYGPGGGEAGGYSPPEGIEKDIYDYLISKGLSDNHALGIMANIFRESGFRTGITNNIGAAGLFQWLDTRRTGMEAAVPDWRTNWRGQIDYALKEPDEPGPQYLKTKFSSPEDAADWWMKKWERPEAIVQNSTGPKIHREYLSGIKQKIASMGKSDSYTPLSISELHRRGFRIGDRLGAGRNHGGVDIEMDAGTPLVAIKDGMVVDSFSQSGGWGETVVMKGNDGIYHLYGHLQRGTRRGIGPVKKGELVGRVGSTGRSDGPHLHWEAGTGWGYDPRSGKITILGRFDALNRYSGYAPFLTRRESAKDTAQKVNLGGVVYKKTEDGNWKSETTSPKTITNNEMQTKLKEQEKSRLKSSNDLKIKPENIAKYASYDIPQDNFIIARQLVVVEKAVAV